MNAFAASEHVELLSEERFRAELAAMHLQWFAAEDEGRTEEATEHKIRKAREEGKVAKSQDVTSAVILLFTVVTLALLSGYLLRNMANMVSYFFRRSTEIDIVTDQTVYNTFLHYFVVLTVPVAAVAFISAVFGNIIQVGALFTVKPITPDLKRVAPKFGQFFKRAFMSPEALFNLFKSFGKVTVIAALAYVNIQAQIQLLTNLVRTPFLQAFGIIARIAFNILVQAAIVLLILAVFDYMFQRKQHRESLKMTKQEVKEERKTYEGDPMVKSRLRQRMQEVLSQNMLQNVPQADVVVTNPTHFAVAMEYKRDRMHAPTVTAKGQDNVAQRMKEIAAESEVPIIENKPLARALYAEVEIGDEIPEQFYEAVVTVLKQVYKMKGVRMEAV